MGVGLGGSGVSLISLMVGRVGRRLAVSAAGPGSLSQTIANTTDGGLRVRHLPTALLRLFTVAGDSHGYLIGLRCVCIMHGGGR